MKLRAIPFLFVKGSAVFLLLAPLPAAAQVVPDTTLPVNTLVTQQGNTSLIEGGTRAGANLFHSFKQFSVLTGNTAFFNNALDIQNIITRVTGGSISNIDGLLRAKGSANLFLLNPNGIIFGTNAQLNIGGSFLASTASRMKFADGNQFTATAPEPAPLLTESVPVGLQFGGNPGAIQVKGTGQGLAGSYESTSPIIRNNSSTGLSVQPGETLALIGGNILLNGANLAAEGGQVELSSIDSGSVSLIPATKGWNLGYEGSPNFKNIQISQQSLVDASGFTSGSIWIQAANVKLADGSIIMIQNQGGKSSGSLRVDASESLVLDGTSLGGRFPSLLLTESVGTGNAGDIRVSTKNLLVQGGAGIDSNTFSLSKGGDISVNAPESIQLLGFSPFNAFLPSNIATATFGTGEAGKITVATGHFMARDGGEVASLSIGSGHAGDVFVKASNSIELITSADLINSNIDYAPTGLATTAFNSGDAGNLTIKTPSLLVGDAAVVNSSSISSGSAGNVNINASNSVEVNGAIGSSVINSPQMLFGSPQLPSGNSGSVTISTGHLSVTNGGLLSVSNDGLRAGGTLTVNARSIFLNSKGEITASTASGEGGNIFLNAQNLQLRHSSLFTAAAGSSGNGGNITIKTGTLAALENSPITANAYQGRGGNILINAQGVFQSPDSKFTASSNLGINGTVQVNTLVNNSTLGLVRLPIVPVDAAKLIAQGCGLNTGPRGNNFVVTGSGGLPSAPTDLQGEETVQSDWGTTNAPGWENRASADRPKKSHNSDPDDNDDFVEATGMIRNAKGQIEFVANAPTYTPAPPWIKPAGCRVR